MAIAKKILDAGIITVLVCLLSVALDTAVQAQLQPTPEVPSIVRDVNPIEDRKLTSSHIPPVNLTRDGRIGFESKDVAGNLRFYLLTPERVESPIFGNQPGAHPLLSSSAPWLVPTENFFDRNDARIDGGHPAICDPTQSRPDAAGRLNPYPCGAANADDCYDLNMLLPNKRAANLVDIYQTPFTVRVTNPKSANAVIASIEVSSSPQIATSLPVEERLLETRISGDGRLLVARIGGPNVYSTYEDRHPPCDFSRWTQTHRLSHAPFDPIASRQFGFARQPFRDSDGRIIGDGEPITGTYPWIDSDANNLVLTTVNARLHWNNGSNSRYPARCVDSNDCVLSDDDGSNYRGHAIMGLWTNGKMVQIDNMLNHIDYGMSDELASQRYLSLYQSGTDRTGRHNGEVRVGAGRFNGDKTFPHGTTTNSAFFDSIENRFNFWDPLQSAAFADVAWTMSNARYTDEFVFDNHINPDAFILSSMVGLRTGAAYYDGWNDAEKGFTGSIRLQNGATAPANRWSIPASGEVTGRARLEPVAMGGVKAKGFWLESASSIRYAITQQPQDVTARDWYLGLFVDSRFANDNLERVLIRFPDNSELGLLGRRNLIFRNSSGAQVWNTPILPTVVALPEKAWAHLGLLIHAGGKRVDIFHDGFAAGRFDSNDAIFQLTPGTLSVGAGADSARPGFRGWIDELVVIAQRPNLESICNQAAGSLVALPNSYQGNLRQQANYYSSTAHNQVSVQLAANGERTYPFYACFHDYAADWNASNHNIPDGAVHLRDAINFPEGPVRANLPRPNSQANAFCLSCHTGSGIDGLGLAALAPASMPAVDDPRRQPSQPWLTANAGNVPANWLAPGLPSVHRQHRNAGINIDHYYQAIKARKSDHPQNQRPKLPTVLAQIGNVGDRVNLSVAATDADGDDLRYAASGLPLGVEIDERSGVISGRLLKAGIYDPTILVDDNKGVIAKRAFDWDVNGDFLIKVASNGHCVVPSSDPGQPGDHLQTTPCNGQSQQVWRIVSVGAHRVKLIHKASNLVAAVDNADPGHNQSISLHDDSSDSHYLSAISTAGSDRYQFVFDHSQYCLFEEAGYLIRQGRCIYQRSSNFTLESLDTLDMPQLDLSALDARVDESAERADVVVQLSQPATDEVRVLAFTQPLSARGGSDYFGTTETLTFRRGQIRQYMSVPILNDSVEESDEVVSIRLANAENANIVKGYAALTIIDDDTGSAPLPTFRISAGVVSESTGQIQIRFSLSEPSSQTVSATVHTTPATATGGSDYYGWTQEISFEPGEVSQSLTVQIIDDAVVENEESFQIATSTIRNALADNTAEIRIRDDD